MRVLKLLCDETYTLDGSEWFVTCTDKYLSGWGEANGKIHKRIYICESHGDAENLAYRMRNRAKKYKISHVNVVKDFPYYRPSRYTFSVEINEPNIWNY